MRAARPPFAKNSRDWKLTTCLSKAECPINFDCYSTSGQVRFWGGLVQVEQLPPGIEANGLVFGYVEFRPSGAVPAARRLRNELTPKNVLL